MVWGKAKALLSWGSWGRRLWDCLDPLDPFLIDAEGCKSELFVLLYFEARGCWGLRGRFIGSLVLFVSGLPFLLLCPFHLVVRSSAPRRLLATIFPLEGVFLGPIMLGDLTRVKVSHDTVEVRLICLPVHCIVKLGEGVSSNSSITTLSPWITLSRISRMRSSSSSSYKAEIHPSMAAP